MFVMVNGDDTGFDSMKPEVVINSRAYFRWVR